MVTKTDNTSKFAAGFKDYVSANSGKTPKLFQNLRQTGWKRFHEVGLPTVKDEDWKYTNIAPLSELEFQISSQFELTEENQLKAYCDPSEINIVFVNGVFSTKLSNLKNLPAGVKITSLAQAVAASDPQISTLLERHNLKNADAFVALNHALITDGAYIHINDKVVVDRLIHIVHVVSSSNQGAIISPRSLISMGKSSEADVLESHISFSNISYFTNALTDIFLAENANLRYCKTQDESTKAYHIGTTQAWLKRDSNFDSFSLSIGGILSRHNLNINLEETGANAILNGLYIVKDNQQVDNHTLVDHLPPNCTSNQFYKGILNDDAHAVFNGKIFVHREAQQTNSYQLNKNLLLGKGCRVDTKPQLEIFADDVKCTHGATIGQLNEDEIFYLRSRAIPEKLATKMLARGFVDDILNRIKNRSICEKLSKLLSANFEILK